MTLLSIKNVSKSFGGYKALRDVSLEVNQGEFVSLLGPSGCGKTTLLRLIAGFLAPDAGTISIDGEDITRFPPHKRPLNTVFQNYALFPHLNILDNVSYGPRRAGASKFEAKERAREALSLVGLTAFEERYPRQLSGGQQQRAALARAIVNRPKLLLLDEPLSALDLQLRKRMQIELKQLQEKLDVAFVFVTHDQEEAMAMSDRIAVMNVGQLEQLGTGEDIYRYPDTRFVAEFIGEASLLPVERSQSMPLHLKEAGTDSDTDTIAVLRPEHVDILVSGAAIPENTLHLPGKVEAVASIGGMTNVYVRALGHLILARRLGLSPDDLREGQEVGLAITPSNLHFIDSGRSR